ncbi:MAG: GtrA family protein [Arenicella sp.]
MKKSSATTHSVLKKQVPKYLMVSGFNTLLAYGLFALFITIGLHYSLAALLPGIISIYFGYIANKKIVFNAQSRHKYSLLFYYLFYFGIYLINVAIQASMHALGSANDYFNGAVAVIITVIIAFVVNKWIFFSKPDR